MTNCPRCGFGQISSNKLHPISEAQFAQAVEAAKVAQMPAIAAGALALWAINRAVNALRHDFVCGNCDLKFSEPGEGQHAPA